MSNNLEPFEIATEPSRETLSLIKRLYEKGGPVDRVYRKFHIDYRPIEFLVEKEGKLWVDKELERKSVPENLKNAVALQLIGLNDYQRIYEKIKEKLEKTGQGQELMEATENFLTDYEMVFEINLKFEKAMKNLEVGLKNGGVERALVLNQGERLVDLPQWEIEIDQNRMIGNSIELSDNSRFCRLEGRIKKADDRFDQWWKELPYYKKEYFKKLIITVLAFSRLREFGRWLMVKNKSRIAELLPNKCQQQVVEKKIAKEETIFAGKGVGVSAGIAEGVVLKKQELMKSSEKQKILYTEVLSPGLVSVLSKVVGIVANRGSMLSHLAIVSREMGIPVVVNVGPGQLFKLGDEIRINGETGEIVKI